MDITQLLAFSVKNKASDLHLSAGLPPMIRVHGDVRRIINTPLISDLIFKGEVSEIKEVMKKNTNTGMQTFDHALFTLFDNGVISYEDALRNADSVNDLRLQIKLNAKRAKVSDLSAGTESLTIAD